MITVQYCKIYLNLKIRGNVIMFEILKFKNVIKLMVMIVGLFVISATLHETFSSYVDQYPPDYEAIDVLDFGEEAYDIEEVQSHVVESEDLEESEYIEDYDDLEEDIDEDLESIDEEELSDLDDDFEIEEGFEVIEFASFNYDGDDEDCDLADNDNDANNDNDADLDAEDCPSCPPCDEEEEDECPPCPPCVEEEEEEEDECPPCPPCDEEEDVCPPCADCPAAGGGKPAPPAGGVGGGQQPPGAPGTGQSPPTLPQTGMVAGLTGLSILAGSGLLASGLAIAKKKNGVKLSVNEILDQEYTEMFEN